MPERVPVYGSSIVQSIAYDEGRREVEVQFLNGAIYAYADVSEEEWQALFHAPSKGSFVNRVLKKHPYRRLA